MSNGLDPDQDRLSVSPDLGPNCLQRLSADGKSCCKQGKRTPMLMYPAGLNINFLVWAFLYLFMREAKAIPRLSMPSLV